MKKDKKVVSKWMYWLSLGTILIIIYKLLDSFSTISSGISKLCSILSPFIVGIIIAYILYLPSKKIELFYSKIKFIRKKARLLSVITVYLVLIAVIALGFRFLIPAVIESIQDLAINFQSYYNTVNESIANLPEDSILKSEVVVNAMESLKNFKVEDVINIELITQYAQGAFSLVASIFDIFVSFVVSVYLLVERREIVQFFKKLINAVCKKDVYDSIGKYFHRTNEVFGKFLSSQFLDGIIVGVLTSIAMSIMGVKYAVVLGMFIGLFNMIPYFGAIIAVGVSIIITILTGGLSKAIEMAVVVIVLQQIDANIINPKIVGESLKMSPLLVIFSVTLGGAYLGFLGMFLAVPAAAMIKVFLCDYIEYKCKKNESKIDKSEEID